MNIIGRTIFYRGKYAESESCYSQSLEIRRRALGSRHPDTLMALNGLANSYMGQGK